MPNRLLLRLTRCVPPRFFSTSTKLLQSDIVLIRQESGVKALTLNRPPQRNAFNLEMWKILTTAIREGDSDPSTNIITFTGNGELFSSGNDFSDAKSFPSLEEYAKTVSNCAKEFVGALIDCKKPVIALVNGGAVGIGCTMLGLCDIVYASNKAYFLCPFASLGVVAEGGSSVTFPKIMGFSKASSVLLGNQRLTAEQAYTCGLVSEVFPHDVFVEETQKKVQAISGFSIKALMYSKELMRGRDRALLHEANKKEESGIAHFMMSEECQAAVRKIFSKKK